LNELMIEQAVAAIPNADVVLFVVDVAVAPREEDKHIAQLLAARAVKRPVIFVLNKMDALAMERAEAWIANYWALLPDYADSIPTSALKGTNLELLREHILRFLPEGPRYYPGDKITDQTEHQIAAELIREAPGSAARGGGLCGRLPRARERRALRLGDDLGGARDAEAHRHR
jgi:GTP-binding protein Era